MHIHALLLSLTYVCRCIFHIRLIVRIDYPHKLTKRGRAKQKYCMRKPFWELITKMVQRGFTSQVAIDKIYRQPRSITKILREIRKDIFTFFNVLCDTGLLLH